MLFNAKPSGQNGQNTESFFVRTILPFVLTTIVGAAITTWYQHLASKYEMDQEARRQLLKENTDLFDRFTRVCENRSFYTRSVLSCLEEIQNQQAVEINKKVLAESREKLRESIFEFNTSWNYFRVMLRNRFGADAESKFYKMGDTSTVVEEFRLLQAGTYSQLVRYDAGQPVDLGKIADLKRQRDDLAETVFNLLNLIEPKIRPN